MLPAIKLARGAEVQAVGRTKPPILRTGLEPKDLSVQIEDVQEPGDKNQVRELDSLELGQAVRITSWQGLVTLSKFSC